MSEPGDRPPVVGPAEERPPVVAGGPDRSVWANARDLFISPGATFRDARRHPRILAPLLVVVAASALAVVIVLVGLGPPDAMRRILEESGLPGGSFATVAVTFFTVVAVAVGTPLSAAIVGGLLWAWSTVRDGVTSFSAAFAAILYVRLLEPVEGIVDALAASALGRGTTTVTIGPTLAVGPDSVSPLVYGALAYVNAFSIWGAVLVGLAGVHAMSLSRRDAAGFAAAIWALGLLIAATAGAAGGFETPTAPDGPSL